MADLTNSSEPVGESETTIPMSETVEPSSPGVETPVNEDPGHVTASIPDEDSPSYPKPSEMALEKQQEDKEDATEAPDDDAGKASEDVVPSEATEVPHSPATTTEVSAAPAAAEISAPTIDVSVSAPPDDVASPLVATNGDQIVEANGEAEIKDKRENEKKVENKEEDSMPPEADNVVVQPHWLPKPCVHLTSIGCSITQEELSPLFSEFGKVASIVFENEKRDAAIIRYETAFTEGEELVAKIKEKLHNTQMGDWTLFIEAFRSDSLLFIGNLTPDIDDELLRKMFGQHGTIERAFVLRNAAGRSKRYGFVEYSLKSQALAAKTAMGNINMDGRVLRVEWSDCKKVADMFSTVLFVDRVPKDPNVEASLRSLFGQYGKVRDCHLAIGMHNQYRGFAFIDFYHSLCADKAHQALDGHVLEGHNIRVSFANPSKSAQKHVQMQAYKNRFGSQSTPGPYGPGSRGAFPGMMGNAPVRGHMPMAMPGQRYMGPGRSGIMGMGVGMQFGRGSHVGQGLVDQGHPGSGAGGMLGTGATPAGMMGRPPMVNSVPPRRGMAVGATLAPIPRMPVQGHSSINPATIAQVATAQAKVREAKARSEEYYQHQPQQTVDNTFKPADSQYGYQQQNQQPNQQQQSSLQTHFQQHVGQHTQQPYAQYYQQAAQGYMQLQPHQQPQQGQNIQSASYYQQQPSQQEQAIQPQPYAYAQQYSQQYVAASQQQYSQQYSLPGTQMNTQQYQQTAQLQVPTQYGQSYNQTVAQSSAQQYQQMNTAPVAANPVSITHVQPQDGTQQSCAAYYSQQQQQNLTPIASSAAQTTTVVGTSQQTLEAQWAAYYASQAAYQQQAALPSYPQQQQQQQPTVQPEATAIVGQKRSHDQMETGPQSQMAYNYQQQVPTSYPQQVSTAAVAYQQNQPTPAIGYQQISAISHSGYQQQTNAQPYPHQTTGTGYQQPIQASATAVPVADGYQQQPVVAAPAAFQPTLQGQAVNAAVYDYNKRPRF